MEHHPGQKSRAVPELFIWAWHGGVQHAQHLPGVHRDGLQWGWMLLMGKAQEMFCRCASCGRTEPREVTHRNANQANVEAVWEKCANKLLIIKITQRVYGVFNTVWQSEKAERHSSGEVSGWEIAKCLCPCASGPVRLAFWGPGL